MASKREKIKLKSSKSHFHYYTIKNKTQTPDRIVLTECKSGATVSTDFFTALDRLTALLKGWKEKRPIHGRVVYGGDEPQGRTSGRVLPWNRICELDWS